MGRKDGTTKRCPVTLRAGQRSIKLAAGACPRREAVDLLSCLNIIPVSFIHQRLFKFDRNSANDAKSEPPPSKSGSIDDCQCTHDWSQMRRAVREYKYEVNEGRMTEECMQYLAQLQKDWERHRVKLGVEALRKEVRISFLSFARYSHPCRWWREIAKV